MRRDADARLLARARAVIPGGVFGHRRTFAFAGGVARGLPENYPHFLRAAEGCRVIDADGRAYVDLLCGYGPTIAGYRRAEVDRAFAAAQAEGVAYSLPSALEVELAERLVARIPGAAWAAFSLSGTSSVDLALTIARAATGRERLVVAEGAWHGNHSGLAVGAGRPAADRRRSAWIPWGDLGALREALRREPVAAVLLCPYDQQVGATNRLPAPGLWRAVREACDEHGALLVLDDIRAGLRLDPGGAAAHFGIDADLVCLSKALANGYPVAATLGRERLCGAAAEVFVSGTFWGFSPALAAALATLELVDAAACARLAAMGERLCVGLGELASARGLAVEISGPPALPLIRFIDDPRFDRACAFAEGLARRGVLAHPTHNWFLSLAHDEAAIDEALSAAAGALDDLAEDAERRP
ncbi:MAG: aminotransferase class III-fold pyridoxal phosphate-dependent enzyme [Myxococcales bacterium]|nr:aminotransferase class III-fold pyridoxal phosphate-dependent enzyme [Myxococcales bacterium]